MEVLREPSPNSYLTFVFFYVFFDFRYEFSVTTRLHTIEHIQDMISLYLEELKEILVFEENKPFRLDFETELLNPYKKKYITTVSGLQTKTRLRAFVEYCSRNSAHPAACLQT